MLFFLPYSPAVSRHRNTWWCEVLPLDLNEFSRNFAKVIYMCLVTKCNLWQINIWQLYFLMHPTVGVSQCEGEGISLIKAAFLRSLLFCCWANGTSCWVGGSRPSVRLRLSTSNWLACRSARLARRSSDSSATFRVWSWQLLQLADEESRSVDILGERDREREHTENTHCQYMVLGS